MFYNTVIEFVECFNEFPVSMTRGTGCRHEVHAIVCKWIHICAINIDKIEAGERLAVEADCKQKINPLASRACSFHVILKAKGVMLKCDTEICSRVSHLDMISCELVQTCWHAVLWFQDITPLCAPGHPFL